MPSPTDAYFEDLQRRGHVPALRNRTATIRFDVEGAEPWTVKVTRGDITVSRATSGTPDCVIAASRKLMDQVLTGRANAMAAMLRGELRTEGDLELLVATRRLLPTPETAETAGGAS